MDNVNVTAELVSVDTSVTVSASTATGGQLLSVTAGAYDVTIVAPGLPLRLKWRIGTSGDWSDLEGGEGFSVSGSDSANVYLAKYAPQAAPVAVDVTVRTVGGLIAGVGASVTAGGGGTLDSSLSKSRTLAAAKYFAGPKIVAPAWQAATAYSALGQVVRLPSGHHIVLTAAGTTGGTAPVIGKNAPAGREFTDGTAKWQVGLWAKTASDADAPVRSSAATAAALGLTETQLSTTLTPPFLKGKGCFVAGASGTIAGFTHAPGTTSLATNAAGVANALGFTGDGFEIKRQTSAVEVTIYDTCVGLVFHNNNTPWVVEIDGVIVEADPFVPTGTPGLTLMYDYGVMAKRKVRFAPGSVRGIALSPQGKLLDGSPTATDCVLILGDSYWDTTPGSATNSAYDVTTGGIAQHVYRRLGFDSCACCNVGGSGYISQNPNTYNIGNWLARPNNQTVVAAYNPSHVIIGGGFNDTGSVSGVANQTAFKAAALAAWQAARVLMPTAKITVLGAWAGASGPGTNHILVESLLSAAFATWGDANSKFVGLTKSVTDSITTGTGLANAALTAGNSGYAIGADGSVHPTPLGARLYGDAVADGILAAWGGNY